MPLRELTKAVVERCDDGFTEILPGLGVVKVTAPFGFESQVYEPLVCLVLQGEKETVVGGVTHRARAGQSLVVSHAVPVTARIVHATPSDPYVSLVAPVDLGMLRSVMLDVDARPAGTGAWSSFRVEPVDDATLDVLKRFVGAASDPMDARVLGPAIRRELHYRLLRSTSGSMLRELFDRNSHASNIAVAIQALRDGYRVPMEMDALAARVGMSVSSFYKHFKTVTATTPLQYQKDLRLMEARRLLLGGKAVSTAAFQVGYQSPSQFSRDYVRKFGTPPSATLSSHLNAP